MNLTWTWRFVSKRTTFLNTTYSYIFFRGINCKNWTNVIISQRILFLDTKLTDNDREWWQILKFPYKTLIIDRSNVYTGGRFSEYDPVQEILNYRMSITRSKILIAKIGYLSNQDTAQSDKKKVSWSFVLDELDNEWLLNVLSGNNTTSIYE